MADPTDDPVVTPDAINAVLDQYFTTPGPRCAETGPGYAVASATGRALTVRPGGYVSGPTQFALADAALYYAAMVAIGKVETMALTSELSIRYLRPAQGEAIYARATIDTVTRRSVVGSIKVWMDDADDRPTAIAQGTYALPR